ncbi:restriction endonuclease [Kitasatospora sp. NPDC101447]|uniref:restriction endonuclease n=1 Tax=Kitasatospora sp. NPDC101447 TaxID=3364102 RepID=UPI0038028B7D
MGTQDAPEDDIYGLGSLARYRSTLLYDASTRLNLLTPNLVQEADVTPLRLTFTRTTERVDRIYVGGEDLYYIIEATRHRRRVFQVESEWDATGLYETLVRTHERDFERFDYSDVYMCGRGTPKTLVIPQPGYGPDPSYIPAPRINDAVAADESDARRHDPSRQTDPAPARLQVIDVMHFRNFENALAALLKRDGFRVVQAGGQANDRAADVIALDIEERRWVIQAKHFRHGQGSVGAPVLYQVNGTAWSVHGADVAVVVTNGRFTRYAEKFAHEQGIYLMGRNLLGQWVDRRIPLPVVLSAE